MWQKILFRIFEKFNQNELTLNKIYKILQQITENQVYFWEWLEDHFVEQYDKVPDVVDQGGY